MTYKTFDAELITTILSKNIRRKFSNEATDVVALVHFIDSGETVLDGKTVCRVLSETENLTKVRNIMKKIDLLLTDYSFRQYLIIDEDGLLSIIIIPWRIDPSFKALLPDPGKLCITRNEKTRGYHVTRNPLG